MIKITARISTLLIAIFMFAQANAAPLTAMDYIEIEQLYAKYNHAIDSGDAEGWANTFVEDGIFNNFDGHDALIGFVKLYTETKNGAKRRHWNTNLLITGDSKKAQGTVYLMMLDLSKDTTGITTTAKYKDVLVKTDEGWRFKTRHTTSDRARK